MELAEVYKEKLLEVFAASSVSHEQIDEVINMVLADASCDYTFDIKLEFMIESLLSSNCSEGAVGFTPFDKNIITEEKLNQLQMVFTDICPIYLRNFCQQHCSLSFDELIEKLTETDYQKKEKDPLDLWDHLRQMLPDADPLYLKNQARVLVKRPTADLEEFVNNAIKNNDYPTMQHYLIHQEKMDEVTLYTEGFTVTKYLQVVPDAVEKFSSPTYRSVVCETTDTQLEEFALNFLYNQFPFLRQNDIKKIFTLLNKHLIKAHNRLRMLPKAFRNPRSVIEQKDCTNTDLLQETAFLQHEKQIKQVLKMRNDRYREALEEAKKYNLLKTCPICIDEELIPEECVFCNKNCLFCKNCVKLGAENVIGEGGTRFPCLSDCDSEFDYSVLKSVLDRKVFQQLCRRKQIEEIRTANIDGLETCPFCDFSMIPADGDKIFKCGNVDCMKESCRECRHISHIPLKCSEIEYDEDVKMRTYIENKMTEAFLRKCWKCSRQFFKESGCNKMTCTCGAKMCYVCGQPVQDYSHFGSGKCPLLTNNLQQFHLNNVLRGAASAKAELGIDNNPGKLKFDPTKDINQQVR